MRCHRGDMHVEPRLLALKVMRAAIIFDRLILRLQILIFGSSWIPFPLVFESLSHNTRAFGLNGPWASSKQAETQIPPVAPAFFSPNGDGWTCGLRDQRAASNHQHRQSISQSNYQTR